MSSPSSLSHLRPRLAILWLVVALTASLLHVEAATLPSTARRLLAPEDSPSSTRGPSSSSSSYASTATDHTSEHASASLEESLSMISDRMREYRRGITDIATASLGTVRQRLSNVLNYNREKGLPGGRGRRLPASFEASQGYEFDLCILAGASRHPKYLSATLESVFKPILDCEETQMLRHPDSPDSVTSACHRPTRTFLLYDTVPQSYDPAELVISSRLGIQDASIVVVGGANVTALTDRSLDPSKYLLMPPTAIGNHTKIFQEQFPAYTLKVASCLQMSADSDRPVLMIEDDIWAAYGLPSYLAEFDRTLRQSNDTASTSTVDFASPSPPYFMSLYEGMFLGNYPDEHEQDEFGKMVRKYRNFAERTANASDALSSSSSSRLTRTSIRSVSSSSSSSTAAQQQKKKASTDTQTAPSTCSDYDYLQSGWQGAGGQGILLSNAAVKREMAACIKEACFDHAFCQDLSYQQCLVNPKILPNYPTLQQTRIYTPRFSLVQHMGIKTTLWGSNSTSSFNMGSFMWHRALNFVDEVALFSNTCMRSLRNAVGSSYNSELAVEALSQSTVQ